MLNFVIIVDDAGELKTVTATEIAKALYDRIGPSMDMEEHLDEALNAVLDARAIAAGEYDPSDNDTPIVATVGGP